MIDRKKQKTVEHQRLPEQSGMMIKSLLNEMPPPLMPHQEVARKEDKDVICEEEVNADEATHCEETDKNRLDEDNIRASPKVNKKKATGGCLPSSFQLAPSSFYCC